MKKLLLSLVLAASLVPSAAQTVTEVSLPADFEFGNIVQIGWMSPEAYSFSVDDWSAEPSTAVTIYDTDFQKIFQFTPTSDQRICELYFQDCSWNLTSPLDCNQCWFTQRLFDDDDAYEYVMLTDCANASTNPKIHITSTDASKKDIVIDPGCEAYDYLYVLYFDNSKMYFCVPSERGDLWYKWDASTSSVKTVQQSDAPKSRASLAVMGRVGETVALSAPGCEGACDVAVFSTHGALVRSFRTAAGTPAIATAGMQVGHYIYKVASEGKQVATGRLILR